MSIFNWKHDEFGIPHKKTGIPCFKCKKRSGVDCPGRKPDESTLCVPCFKVRMFKFRVHDFFYVRWFYIRRFFRNLFMD